MVHRSWRNQGIWSVLKKPRDTTVSIVSIDPRWTGSKVFFSGTKRMEFPWISHLFRARFDHVLLDLYFQFLFFGQKAIHSMVFFLEKHTISIHFHGISTRFPPHPALHPRAPGRGRVRAGRAADGSGIAGGGAGALLWHLGWMGGEIDPVNSYNIVQ